MKRRVATCVFLGSLSSSLGIAAGGSFTAETVLGSRPIASPGGIALDGDVLFVVHPSEDELTRVDLATGEVTPIASEDDSDAEELVTPDDIWRDPLTGDLYVTELLAGGVRRLSPPDWTRTRILAGFNDAGNFVDNVVGLRRPGEPLRIFISVFPAFSGPETKMGIWEIDPAAVLPPRLVYGSAGGVDVFGEGLHGPDSLEFDPSGRQLFVSELFGGKLWAIDVDSHTARLVYDPRRMLEAVGAAFRFQADGSIAYAEYDTGRLLRIDPDGHPDQVPTPIADLGEPGIHNLAVHSDGRILGSNFVFGGVTAVGPDGRRNELFPRSLNIPNSVHPLGDGRLAIGDYGSVAVVDPDAPPPARLSRPRAFLVDNLDLAVGVGSAGGCDLYATAFRSATLQHVDLCDPDRPATDVLPAHTFGFPADIAVADASELWLTDMGGFVWHVTGLAGAAPAGAWRLPGDYSNPTGIALRAGALYVSESRADRVRIVDAQSGLPIGLIDGLEEPEGLAFESDGSLLVVEARRGRLTRIRLDGGRETVIEGLATKIHGAVLPFFNFFADVAVTDAGEIFVASPADGSLTRLTPHPEHRSARTSASRAAGDRPGAGRRRPS